MTATALDIVRAAGGTWHGSWGAIPGPDHSPRDRSTTVRDREDGAGVVVHSFIHDWREVRRDLAARGIDLTDTVKATPGERAAAKARAVARDRERERGWREAAVRCQAWWDGADDATPDHAYLVRKRIGTHGARLDRDGRLLLPMFGPDHAIVSLQRIAPDGSKLFAKGARPVGGWMALGGPQDGPDGPASAPETIVIAEGFATAATIAEATSLPVLAAFTAANMLPVAQWAMRAFVGRRFLVAADHDAPSQAFPVEGGAGLHFATRAAAQCAGHVVGPADRGDWNDHGGAATVRAFKAWS